MKPWKIALTVAGAMFGLTLLILASTTIAFAAHNAQGSAAAIKYASGRKITPLMPAGKDPTLHVVAFATLGPPHDQGMALGESLRDLHTALEPWVATVTTWSPRDIPAELSRAVAYECDGSRWPQQQTHCNASKHGFWRWKPHVVERRLMQIPEGHWLYYMDGNVGRNVESLPGPDFAEFVARWRELCDDPDLMLHSETFGLSSWLCCRRDVVREHLSSRAARREPYCPAWRLCVRNSARGRSFVRRWRELCDDPNKLWPSPDRTAPIMHHHDEALLNVVVGEWKDRGRLPWGFPHNRSMPIRAVSLESVVPGVSSGWLRDFLAPVLPWRALRPATMHHNKFGDCVHKKKKKKKKTLTKRSRP